VTLLVFRRGLPHVAWIIGYLILLWLLAALLAQFREGLEARGWHLPVRGADYAVQSLMHALLLFVLPAYYASATLSSPNALFLGLLVGLAVLATFDPWFAAVVGAWPWARHAFVLVSGFAALNVALPLVRVPPLESVAASALVAVLALTPMVRRARPMRWARAVGVTAAAALAAAVLAVLGRSAIPPVPLALADGAMARSMVGWAPEDRIEGVIAVEELRRWGGLVAYTAIYAPAGLSQPIEHVWRRDGRPVTVVRLSPVRGGRREGFRTYSRKTGFPADPAGRWSVDVVTSAGQLIGRLRFRVTP
jgi:hypothetical protein